ncbi:MAG: ATP-binding cassette domain-containing protein [Proteobacteria bacterium]|nr:ATP-binding cassette domain-containing protein [Pseudomonadota bacterium]
MVRLRLLITTANAAEPLVLKIIFDGIDFTARPGERLAIVGPSGSGKTAPTALLMCFYDPPEGTIRLDGGGPGALKERSIRRNIGIVLQEPLLFNDGARANIATPAAPRPAGAP